MKKSIDDYVKWYLWKDSLFFLGSKLPGKSNEFTIEIDVNFNSAQQAVITDEKLMGINSYIMVGFPLQNLHIIIWFFVN